MKTNDTSARELALDWWESLTYKQKDQYRGFLNKYTSMDSPVDPVLFADSSLVTEIWLSELINKQQSECIEKPNRKQFKEFSPELFKAYIDKFSDEDKIKAMKMLYDEHQEFKKFDKVKVVLDKHNASQFHNNGRGIYKIYDWANTIFEVAGEFIPVTFKYDPNCYGAYPLRLVGEYEIIGYVYNEAIQKI